MSNSQTIQENNERINAVTELLKTKAAGGTPTEVYDGLDSTSTTAALSANQGRVLKESIPTNYGASLSLTIDSSTYVVTAQLKDPAGNNLGEAQTIDLPLESVVVSGGYDESTKEVVLTLKDNSVIRFSIGDLIDGLVSSGELANYYTKSEVDNKIPDTTALNNKITNLEKYAPNNLQFGENSTKWTFPVTAIAANATYAEFNFTNTTLNTYLKGFTDGQLFKCRIYLGASENYDKYNYGSSIGIAQLKYVATVGSTTYPYLISLGNIFQDFTAITRVEAHILRQSDANTAYNRCYIKFIQPHANDLNYPLTMELEPIN